MKYGGAVSEATDRSISNKYEMAPSFIQKVYIPGFTFVLRSDRPEALCKAEKRIWNTKRIAGSVGAIGEPFLSRDFMPKT